MKHFQGIASNIETYIIGKVIKKFKFFNFLKFKNDYIFVTDKNLPKWIQFFPIKALILENFVPELFKNRIPFIYNISKEELNSLQEGDIVLLKKDGSVNILYEVLSPHNALFVTNKCNLMCLTCPQPPNTTQALKFEENLKILKMMNSTVTKSIAITGGEPTILNEKFIKLIEACQRNLPKTSIIVLTNGIKFADFEFTKRVVGVSKENLLFAISLYSDNDIVHDILTGMEGSFFKTIKGIYNLALFKQKIEIRIVLTKMNIDRLPNIVEFIYRNFPFVIHVALMGLEVTGNARKNVDLLWIDPFEYRKELLIACKYLIRYNLHFSIYNHPLCVVPESLRKFCRQSISPWKKVYMDICEKCSVKSSCGGFFITSAPYYTKYVTPL